MLGQKFLVKHKERKHPGSSTEPVKEGSVKKPLSAKTIAKMSNYPNTCRLPNCGKMFDTAKNLEKHRLNKHPETTKNPCDICQHNFTSPDDLEKHKQSHLETNNESFKCTECNVEFAAIIFFISSNLVKYNSFVF